MSESDVETITLIAASFFLGGISKGLLGLGLPMVVMTILGPFLGVKLALALLIVPALLTNIWQAWAGDALVAILKRLWPFFVAAVFGVWIGSLILIGSSDWVLLMLLGCGLTVYAAISLVSPPLPEPGPRELWMAPGAAFTGGILFGMVGNFIVPGILYLQALNLGRNALVQAMGVSFVVLSASLAAFLAGHAVLTMDELAFTLITLPMAVAGMAVGIRLRGLVSEERFRTLFFVALLAAGILMAVRASVS
ncbi:MAG: sulfite exporter TauE/SafE family protein [Pseudomonadota bacterium]